MSDEREAEKPQIEEAIVGIKGEVKSLQQITSSGRAAQRKRVENHAQKAFSALDAAFEKHLKEEDGRAAYEKSAQ
ncbi:uncharacterized protein N7483_010139 [Penicillium malachiteum]|uniref:uncharacterized protein n=1 Tax=Penicillium malachiteum TaxID=1324776 RepID=UPI002549B173|nr:uncharacterized protein N7483_010139 [Penicillium malachiteum]KAJ5712958.1 hypothetical protein N7483_010139 [Penicillium malachiteum]